MGSEACATGYRVCATRKNLVQRLDELVQRIPLSVQHKSALRSGVQRPLEAKFQLVTGNLRLFTNTVKRYFGWLRIVLDIFFERLFVCVVGHLCEEGAVFASGEVAGTGEVVEASF